ncbi:MULTISPECIES: GNAT family protein [unclassified Paenibacillus]|uniref:GNAT family N-acetyltransferase n=1 Tax=Paenibacillus provencensis TaxID=441151 RepID=A0ABW3Q910_9BACL|nr:MULTISPECIES: GNAT family protein [unclassified Paenibacillus]MCM3129460.1 GNAT family N-acetyltransferase [Paenibacillus sp. MER 78]SFS73488.1 ribosomal-protein-alanine N-acetyltransferase [Paenibacillus sp. 453mf]
MYVCGGYIPELKTERLLLRKLTRTDSKEIYTIWSDPKVTTYMNIAAMHSVQEAEDMIDLLDQASKTEDGFRWAIILRESGAVIGSCGYNYWQLQGAFRGEIGYELASSHWRKGYMTEALQAVLQYGFETMGLNRIEALVDPRNTASQQLLHALSFQCEGLLRQLHYTSTGYKDMQMHSILFEEWKYR